MTADYGDRVGEMRFGFLLEVDRDADVQRLRSSSNR